MIIKWIIVAIAFHGLFPTNSKIFTLDPERYATASDCQKEADDLRAKGAEKGVEIWAVCLEVKREPTKSNWKGEPGTEQRS